VIAMGGFWFIRGLAQGEGAMLQTIISVFLIPLLIGIVQRAETCWTSPSVYRLHPFPRRVPKALKPRVISRQLNQWEQTIRKWTENLICSNIYQG
jgi:hypothetical protein